MKSAFGRCHPAADFVFFAAVIVFAMLINHPLFSVISLLASLAYAIRLRGKSAVKTFFGALLPMLLFVTAVNALFSHYGVTVLHEFKSGNALTLEAVVYGASTGALVVNTILWFMCYNEVVTEDKFMHLFGKRMPHLALLVMMVLRFVPLYANQLSQVNAAAKGAGVADEKGRFSKIRNGASAVSGVITWALEHSIETADSMKSRGYGLKGRTSCSRFVLSPRDVVLLCVTIALSIFIAVSKALGAADAVFNPVIRVSGFSPLLAAAAVCYALLCFMPVIYDFAEEIRWNRLYAKG